MSHPAFATRPYALNGLRAARTARTRIFAAGSDPYFGRGRLGESRRSTVIPPAVQPNAGDFRLWRAGMLDRLSPPLTRYRE